jgi:hypothetical protein
MMAIQIKTFAEAPKIRRARVYPRLSVPVRRRLAEYCAAKGVTERDFIEGAILEKLDGTSDGAKVLARLDRIDQTLDAERQRHELQQHDTHRDVEVLSEAFGRFLRLWMFVHAGTFQQPTTHAAAEILYQQFAAKIAEHFLRGHRFIHDLPKVDAGSRA